MKQLANSCIPYIALNGSKGVGSMETTDMWAPHKWHRHCDRDDFYVIFTFNIHVSVGTNDVTWKRMTNQICTYKVQETPANTDGKQCLQVGTSAYRVCIQHKDKIFERRCFQQVKSPILQPRDDHSFLMMVIKSVVVNFHTSQVSLWL